MTRSKIFTQHRDENRVFRFSVPIIGGFLKTLLPYISLKLFSVAIPVLDDKGSVFESCIEKSKLAVDLYEY